MVEGAAVMPAAPALRAEAAVSALRPTEPCKRCKKNRPSAGFFYWIGVSCSGLGENGHGIAIGKKTIVAGDGFLIGGQDPFPTRHGRHQKEQ